MSLAGANHYRLLMSRGVVRAAAAAASGGGARRWRLAGIILTGKAAGLPCRTHVVRPDRPLVARNRRAAWVFPFTAR